MDLIKELKAYEPYNQQELVDKKTMIKMLEDHKDIFVRDNTIAHMTASAWVVNQSHDQVLMAYHNIYDSWSWLGGHADGETDLAYVALKEVGEESGVTGGKIISDGIFSIEILTVDGHERRGQYVGSHLHLNVTYLVEVNQSQPLIHQPDENSDVAWFDLEEAIKASSEEWFKKRIYTKLNDKLNT